MKKSIEYLLQTHEVDVLSLEKSIQLKGGKEPKPPKPLKPGEDGTIKIVCDDKRPKN